MSTNPGNTNPVENEPADLAEQAMIEAELMEAAELELANAEAERRNEEWCDGVITMTDAAEPPPTPAIVYTGVEGEFELRHDGVFKNTYEPVKDSDEKEKQSEFLCSRLEVIAQSRSIDGGAWSYMLEWRDRDRRKHQWPAPASMLASVDTDLVKYLSDRGMYIPGGKSPSIKAYIRTVNPPRRLLSVDRTGWFSDKHGRVFVLPNQVVGTRRGGDEITFQTDLHSKDFRVGASGNLPQWRHHVARLCVGNNYLVFAASVALASPVLELVKEDSAGFHLYGRSSKGKTTALQVAQSVWGYAKQSWRTTDNALEDLAECHNNVLLPLDELAELNPHKMEAVVYMLSDGMGKARMEKTMTNQRRKTWRSLFLSTGEHTPKEIAAKAGIRIKAGVEVRMVNLSAIVTEEFGLFENIHGTVDDKGRPNPEGFSKLLQRNTDEYRGVAGPAWVTWLIQNETHAIHRLREMIEVFMNDRRIVPAESSGEVRRVARRFAVVGAVGELATEADITRWPGGTAMDSAAWCFQRWCSGRSLGSSDLDRAVDAVRAFLLTNAHRFQNLDGQGGGPIRDRAGYVRMKSVGANAAAGWDEEVAEEYFILREVFQSEICDGHDDRAVAEELVRRGYLRRDKKHFPVLQRVPGLPNPIRMYAVQAAILSGSEDVLTEAHAEEVPAEVL